MTIVDNNSPARLRVAAVPPLAAAVPSRRDALPEGCYALTLDRSGERFEGTLRVDRSAPGAGPDDLIASGDLYRRRPDPPPPRPDVIPILPRGRYDSYLAVTGIDHSGHSDRMWLEVDRYRYQRPAEGSFTGAFPAAPSRRATIELTPVPPPAPYSGPSFAGDWREGDEIRGKVTLSRVSEFFRRAVVEIDTVAGAVAPQPVPDGVGVPAYFDTVYARAGWQLTVVTDRADLPVPPGVDAFARWKVTALHELMLAVRDPAADLDREWRVHLLAVPARIGCDRGIMYDVLGAPREGCVTYSDDGYPAGESAHFGAATDRHQRDVPRAYLRSAIHEVTHAFNQVHQSIEGVGRDNSIMSSTPEVAEVLAGPDTGAPGVFPDQIDLTINPNVRHHLVHMPDPIVRPGGWSFGIWRSRPSRRPPPPPGSG